jgi:hypothetical protein
MFMATLPEFLILRKGNGTGFRFLLRFEKMTALNYKH